MTTDKTITETQAREFRTVPCGHAECVPSDNRAAVCRFMPAEGACIGHRLNCECMTCVDARAKRDKAGGAGTGCQHPADKASTATLLRTCPDCGAECSGTSIGDDDLCYDERCPLHVMAGPPIVEYSVNARDSETPAPWMSAPGVTRVQPGAQDSGRCRFAVWTTDPSALEAALEADDDVLVYSRG